jgi:hypothetical protein
MPTISRFFGIMIRMYHNEHQPPHFHARYGSQSAVFTIADLRVLESSLPRRAERLVLERARMHRIELMENWQLVQRRQNPAPIAPLE